MNSWKQEILEEGIESCGRFYGSYLGLAVDTEDPLEANRILVSIPEVYGDRATVRIALPNFGIMGKDYGTHFLPQKNAIVYVTFRQGDIRYPLWSPGPWANNERPKEFDRDTIFGFKSRTGHIVAVDDEDNTITVQHKDGYFIELKEKQVTIGSKKQVVIKDDEILLGKSNSPEPAVLGNQLKEHLGELIDLLKAMTIPTSAGPMVMNSASAEAFTAWKNQLGKILAKFTT